ncbi:MAG: sigma-54-dependent Fis family transcriptional regulator [Kofleriaceae bacterium]|nr:sigma-54-dependent Fis family transcriptional regulator [Kofleriaceae bacterium]
MQPAEQETPDPSASWSALVVDDDPGVRQSVRLCLEADGGRVLGVGSTKAALEALERGRFDVILLDLWLGRDSGLTAIPQMLAARPNVGIIVITAYASFETAVEAMRLGAVDYLPKPFTPEQVRFATRRVVAAERMRRRIAELEQRALAEGDDFFATESPRYRTFLQQVQRAARADAVVLLRGESGTGKNVLARYLVSQGPRAERPFVMVRGGDGDSLAAKLDEAAGGTLYLDEIGELSLDAQNRLLAWLGDERHAEVRIVASTNRSLEDEVRAGRFREDLQYRLEVIPLTLPPLRERIEDIVPLARHYLALYRRQQGRPTLELSARAIDALVAEKWPGNLRQLRNAIERAVILAPGHELEPEDLGLAGLEARAKVPILGSDVTIEQLEIEHIARVIARAPSLEAAAKILGIDPTTLQRKRKRYGLS